MPGKITKKPKKGSGSAGDKMSDAERRVKELEAGVYEGAANANNIVDLLELCKVTPKLCCSLIGTCPLLALHADRCHANPTGRFA